MLKEILLVGAGGFAGSVCRYLAALGVASLGISTQFPVATFSINALGSLLIGFLMSLSAHNWVIFIGIVGFCGGFTTFSTFSAETLTMLRAGQWAMGAGYILLSVVVCVAAVAVGMWAGKNAI
jgi:CrcB protein